MILCESGDEFENHVEIDGTAGELADQTLSIIKFLKETLANDNQTKMLWHMFRRDAGKILGYEGKRRYKNE